MDNRMHSSRPLPSPSHAPLQAGIDDGERVHILGAAVLTCCAADKMVE